jgi:chromosome segregation ATPase
MTQAPNDRSTETNRQFVSLGRRIDRLEDTQITGRELNQAFGRVYDDIDSVEDKIDGLQCDFDEFRQEVKQKFDEINRKLDAILLHTTGIN